jgi:2-polyprenyl-3-methyl-5-hydroxy-6-metoxy-1,4-benzoquinol methylase
MIRSSNRLHVGLAQAVLRNAIGRQYPSPFMELSYVSIQTIISPERIFSLLFGYQQTAALKAAIDLGLFTAIDEGAQSVGAIAAKVGASERGVRILCDYLTILNLLNKSGSSYELTQESAMFLSKRSPAYFGTTASFLTLPEIKSNFDRLTETVRRGGVAEEGNTVATENPIWIEFARAMVPMAVPSAMAIADLLGVASAGPQRVLDIAAGHGMFGITLAQRNPQATVTAVDWAPVLAVAQEHARAHGVADRVQPLAGDAFDVEFGKGYDIALVTNFLHHFDHATCTRFLAKVHSALGPGGRVAVLEFVPNPDRVSPPMAAAFSLTMLAGTPAGDAYTFDELRQQLEAAGFRDVSAHQLPLPQTVVLAHK